MGWKAVYENQSDDEEEELKRQNLPVMQKGQEFSISNIRLTGRKNKATGTIYGGDSARCYGKSGALYGSGNKEMAKTLGETGG